MQDRVVWGRRRGPGGVVGPPGSSPGAAAVLALARLLALECTPEIIHNRKRIAELPAVLGDTPLVPATLCSVLFIRQRSAPSAGGLGRENIFLMKSSKPTRPTPQHPGRPGFWVQGGTLPALHPPRARYPQPRAGTQHPAQLCRCLQGTRGCRGTAVMFRGERPRCAECPVSA